MKIKMKQKAGLLRKIQCIGSLCILFGILSASFVLAQPIRIGAPIPVTGPFSSDGKAMEMGLKLALDNINSKGGLLGQQLELHIFDIGDLTPDKLQAAAANLIEKMKVDVLINGYGGMGPDIPAFCPYDVPYIHNDGTSNVVSLRNRMKCSNILMGADTDENYGRITFKQLMALKYTYPSKKLAVIHGPYDWELNTTKGAKDIAKKMGWEIVLNEEVPYGTKQWGGIISKLRSSDPALIYFELLDPAAVKTFIDQFMDNPSKNALLYAGYTVSVPAFGDIIRQGAAEGVIGMTLSAHRPNEKGEAFKKLWIKKYGTEPPYSIGAAIYDELMMWADSVKSVGNVKDYPAIIASIKSAKYNGITGVYKFNDDHFIESENETIPAHLLQAQNSQTKQIMIGDTHVNDFITPAWIKK